MQRGKKIVRCNRSMCRNKLQAFSKIEDLQGDLKRDVSSLARRVN